MNLSTILAVVCIIVGLIGEIVGEKLLMPTLEWFVLAIALALLELEVPWGRKQ